MLPIVERESRALDPDGVLRSRLEQLSEFSDIKRRIEAFWLLPSNRATTAWRDHRDINEVMLATSLAPDEFLSI